MTHPIRRRTLLTGAFAAAAVPALATAPAAHGDDIDYDSPAAFDTAAAAFREFDVPHNEAGQYAWGTSYYLQGLLRMYEAHRDEQYLDLFEEEADHVLSSTDEARGVTDYRGQSGPAWRASGNYTAAHATLPGADDEPAVQIRWAGVQPQESGGGTAAETLVSMSPSARSQEPESRAMAEPTSDDTFDLTLTNPNAEPLVLESVSLDPDSDTYVVHMINDAYEQNRRWTAKELREDPGPAPAPDVTLTFESQFFVFPVHTGMVAYPLAKYARIVLHDRALNGRSRTARRLRDASRRAVDVHDEEFVHHGDGSGDYVYPKGAPVPFDGLVAPYNMSHGLGQALAELYTLTGSPKYLARIRAIVRGFRRGLVHTDKGAYTWTYWPPYSEVHQGFEASDELSEYTPAYQPSQQPDDISHAAISVEFVHAAARIGLGGLGRRDLERFAATYTENIILSDSTVANNVDGSEEAAPGVVEQCARWLGCAQQDYRIHEQALAVYDALDSDLQEGKGFEALGVGYLNWAAVRAWE